MTSGPPSRAGPQCPCRSVRGRPLAPAGRPRHTRGMRRVRWAIIGVGLAAYWTAVGHEVMSARQATRDRYLGFEWIAAGALTLPWSCLSDVAPKPAPADERALLTA